MESDDPWDTSARVPGSVGLISASNLFTSTLRTRRAPVQLPRRHTVTTIPLLCATCFIWTYSDPTLDAQSIGAHEHIGTRRR